MTYVHRSSPKPSRMFVTLSPFRGEVVQARMLWNREDLLALAVQQTLSGEFIFSAAMSGRDGTVLSALGSQVTRSFHTTARDSRIAWQNICCGKCLLGGDSALLLSSLQREKEDISD